jgi:hypothetical protein
MGKYDGLGRYLRRQHASELEFNFREIERLITDMLPKSAARPQWWANEQSESTHVQCAAWLNAGFNAFLIAGTDRVCFRRRA